MNRMVKNENLTVREVAIILASLRLAQETQGILNDVNQMPHMEGQEPIKPEEIDEICESINCAPPCVELPLVQQQLTKLKEYLEGEAV